MASTVTVVSFGYLHGGPPAADFTADLRHHFRDPHFDPALRELTADDPRVATAVMATPGVPALVLSLRWEALAYLAGHLPVTVAVGCSGGRHRAPAVAAELARRLRGDGVTVFLNHRDIGKPVIRHTRQEVRCG